MKVFTLSLIFLTAFGCGDDDPDHTDKDRSVLELAEATPELSTLVAAVEYASDDRDLISLLERPGALTVFAPTNDAFDALAVELTGNADAQGTELLTEANRPLLRSVLQYHILTTEVRAAEIPFGMPITSAQGSIFKIEEGDPPVIVDGRNREARITRTDLEADNGVVHVIDRVLLPADRDVVQVAQAAAMGSPPEFKILVEAIEAADLTDTLSGPGPFTVLAPTDAAFMDLLAEIGISKQQLLANKPLLTKVLTYHVIGRRWLEAELPEGTPITTVEGGMFTIDESLEITDERGRTAKIITTDRFATNGMIHVLDRVLLPAP